jgi:hypothetical protein
MKKTSLEDEVRMLRAEWHAEIERSKLYAETQDKIFQLKDAIIRGLQIRHEELLLKHEREKNLFLKSLQSAMEEIERLKDEGEKDYAGMREFQMKFIKSDHELRDAKELLTRAADTLGLSHTTFDPECGVCQLIKELRKAAG